MQRDLVVSEHNLLLSTTHPAASAENINADLTALAASLKDVWGDSLLKVILFGSRARGDFNKFSDYDFMILLDFHPADVVEEMCKGHRILADALDAPVDCLVMEESMYQNKFLFRSSVESEGVVLYEK